MPGGESLGFVRCFGLQLEKQIRAIMLVEALIATVHRRRHASGTVMFEIVCVLILPVMLIVYYTIQRLVVHHSNMEVKLLIQDLVVEAMNKHDHDFDD